MHFLAICRPKFQTCSLWCLPWGHPTKAMSSANTKETESVEENGCRQKCLDKSLPLSQSVTAQPGIMTVTVNEIKWQKKQDLFYRYYFFQASVRSMLFPEANLDTLFFGTLFLTKDTF